MLVGLDHVGKTSLLFKLKLNQNVNTIPTIGFNVETVTIAGMNLVIWDVGGGDKIRPLWKHYSQESKGIIFMVDSSDRERIKEASKDALFPCILDQDVFQNIPILVLANKQDIPNCMTLDELNDNLNLPPQNCYLHLCSVKDGTGVKEGLELLVNEINKRAQIN
ncbi:putative apoptosis inducing factor [Tieghemostelium lacteum]|uniref:Putative apoptosis inducing factor n=1 Tax=Tieghemostelium lacteum TaxID=361077 RepID=A0A151ZJ03_TIELA|nr:putative apoptosis inducing factor [Tieghemostelium lacteum]|eukprot:KYQ93972.1 putative apoptosis inducing factor [Tieghemostelium lacteum]